MECVDEVWELKKIGYSNREISKHTGLNRSTNWKEEHFQTIIPSNRKSEFDQPGTIWNDMQRIFAFWKSIKHNMEI
mgnify:FL=1